MPDQPARPAVPNSRAVWLLGASLLLATAAGAMIWFADRGPSVQPLPESRYLNTRPDVAFVGAERCAECHKTAHDSWLQTAHSRALSDLHVETEPPDGTVNDPRSKRQYAIERRAGQMHHRESIRRVSGAEVTLSDFTPKYLIGSGRFSRSYLIEDKGFLCESPVTWYAARKGWGLSPGYDHFNKGFERPVEVSM